MGFFQRRSISIYAKNKNGLPALEAPVIDVEAEPDVLTKPDTSRYGIDSVIGLMRKLPQGDLDTVVSVLKHTLASVDVELSHIIEDADDKVEAIRDRLSELHAEIIQYQEDIKARVEEIAHLESDLVETLDVKEDLVYAEKITNKHSADSQSAAELFLETDNTKVSYSNLSPEMEDSDSQNDDQSKESSIAEVEMASPDIEDDQEQFDPQIESSEPLVSTAPIAPTAPTPDEEVAAIQSPVLEREEDDGIPVIQAIDLDEHIVQPEKKSIRNSFEDTLKKTKAKLDKVVSV